MKNYGNYDEKRKEQQWKNEQNAGGFKCSHCKQWVIINEFMGTANRNHCNICLWSKHVDEKKGDRNATCQAGMKPIGLTFKHEGYGRQGEIMLIHLCSICGKIAINRIAGDDMPEEIIEIFDNSQSLDNNFKQRLLAQNIYLLENSDRRELLIQLFGN
ncbi:MAG TPA: RNHCP domain-containing protein [Candidatus Saccharimonadales bacterium]|nr:RNHCP domain-containing protein [Candidatus Saccharimonadales bacterium]